MKILRRIYYLLCQRHLERDLAEEIEFHREISGNLREMGNITRAREDARAVWIWPWLQSVWQDATYAIRNLRHQPGFALLALASLGAAIGINTSLFTVFNALALRPWPVKDPARVVKVFKTNPRQIAPGVAGIEVAEWRYFATHTHAFSGLAVTRDEPVHFGFEAFGKSSYAELVSGDYFIVLGVGMHLGRGFLPEEDRVESPQAVAVLGYPYWRDHFGSDMDILGKQVRIEDIPFTVVGITPESFTGTSENGARKDVYLPLAALLLLHPTESWPRDVLTKPDWCCAELIGRLAPEVSRAGATAELEVLDRQFRGESGAAGRRFVLAGSVMLNPGRKEQIAPMFALMFTGVTLIVLLACANVGNLLVARAEARRKEIEIRRAIGAGRARIVRQLMTESVLLATGAAALGVILAYRLPVFVIAQFGEVPAMRMTPDGTVLAYAVALAAFSCISFGLAPALHGTRSSADSRLPLRNWLLAAQVALSVILLIGAELMLQGVARLRTVDPGFAVDRVSVVSFDLPARSYDAAHARAFYRQLGSLHSSQTFGLTAREPLSLNFAQRDFRPGGSAENQAIRVDYQEVTPEYFELLRIPIVAGRNFDADDAGRNVVLVNETLARRFWKGEFPVGKTIMSGRVASEIVGIVKDAHTGNLDEIEPVFYVPFARGIPKIVLASDAPGTVQAIRAAVAQIEPRVRMQVSPLRDNLDRWLRGPRLGAEMAGVLGLFALILATVGMSGVFAYVVQQRTKEIGIRMALGARPGQVIRLVLGGSSRAVAIGVGVGFSIALPASRLMRNALYGVSTFDPVAYLSVACVLALAALAASYAPARRAAKTDPMMALRHE